MRHLCQRGAGQGRADRLDQAAVRVGGDQRDPGQATGDQVAEERQPAGAVLGAADLQATPADLPVAVGVHPGREQRVDVDRAAALADLEDQRVGGHERVRAGVQRAGAERLHLRVEVLGHRADTWLFDNRVMPSVSTSFSIRRVDTPSRYDVATTDTSAASARRRRSSSQSGK